MKETAVLGRLADVARYLGCTEQELQRAIDRGLLPVVPPNASTLVHDADLEKFVDRGGMALLRSDG